MKLGAMNTLVVIEQVTAPRNDVNGDPETWGEFCKCWCKAETGVGNEPTEGQQQVAGQPLRLETHWTEKTDAITAEMRAVLPDGRRLGIVSAVDENFAHRVVVITGVLRAESRELRAES
jgi:head-tail adaptor